MALLGKSFDDKVREAIAQIDGMALGVKALSAAVSGKTVTLTGEVPSLEVKTRVMAEFNSRVDADNVVNRIRIAAGAAPKDAGPAAAAVAPGAAEFEWYEVQKGDTLSALAKRFYGKGSQYMKIFNANKDVLTNPDLIKVGQRLRIPK
jgi:nucleoid-associated protein YgaU